ncbi:hypothetical protein [Ancylobacter pratisalsi]|uniref:Uncharacterized protein n=1 Tax=Ancylobacter pratisalsi TaxID=1745854 RepID=A0A6P1YP00_9HYPH|nr:hypothetical protein [Ancylobacter pratisalsi]QIB34426.1 hypothetical protein G3A50_12430 [Ancylobacter pratisalsi]
MWAIVMVALHVLTGPQIRVITKPADVQHVYASEEACQAVLKADLPGKLQGETAQQYEDGYRRYVCVRIRDTEHLKLDE